MFGPNGFVRIIIDKDPEPWNKEQAEADPKSKSECIKSGHVKITVKLKKSEATENLHCRQRKH